VDLPAPGGPVMPRTARPCAGIRARARSTRCGSAPTSTTEPDRPMV